MPESLESLPFPMHGVNLVTEFESQPPQTTPIGVNVRAFDSLALRNRGGSRPGLAEYIPQTVLGFPSTIQHLNIIVDPTVAGLTFDGSDLPPDETILDPSTNNHRVRNPPPGRQVRRRGSGRGLNIHFPPQALTLTAADQEKNKGDTFTFDGTEFTASPGTSGVTSVTLTSEGAPAGAANGDYDIVISQPMPVPNPKLWKPVMYVRGNMTVSGDKPPPPNPDVYPIPIPPGATVDGYFGVLTQDAPTVGMRYGVFVTRDYTDNLGNPQSDSAGMSLTLLHGGGVAFEPAAITLGPVSPPPFGMRVGL